MKNLPRVVTSVLSGALVGGVLCASFFALEQLRHGTFNNWLGLGSSANPLQDAVAFGGYAGVFLGVIVGLVVGLKNLSVQAGALSGGGICGAVGFMLIAFTEPESSGLRFWLAFIATGVAAGLFAATLSKLLHRPRSL